MRKTVGVFGIGDIECEELERLVRNIRPGDVLRVDSGDGITTRWVYVQVGRTYPTGPSRLRGVQQTHIDFRFPGYPKDGSTWCAPYWASNLGSGWDSNHRVTVYRPVRVTVAA